MKKNELALKEYLAAAALRAAGARLLRVEPGAGGRCSIVFSDEDGTASRLLEQHRAGTLRLSSRDMGDAVQAVKSEIFGARRG